MRHILVVDDESDVATLFQGYLEACGYRVTVAYDGVDALTIDERDPADAVVTDAMMPRMNGRDLIMRLRERRPELPAIVVSGYPGDQALGGGHTAFFSKPVRLATLARQLGEMLGDGLPSSDT